MRKHTFLIATAVAALTIGSGAAFAQGAPNTNAPAEKAAPGAHGGAAPSHNAAPPNRMGESGQNTNRGRETTGQAPNEQPGMQKGTPKSDRLNERGEGNKATKPNERSERNERNRSTTGQAPNEQPGMQKGTPKSDRLNERSEGNKATKPNERSERNERNRSTTGQGTNENRGSNMENRSGTNENRANEPRGNASSARGGSANLTVEQRTKIHSIIVGQRSAPRVARVDFDVSVGTRVPRTVHLVAVPETIVSIEPSWRGFQYFLVGDEIVVVDPGTMEIVAVLPA